MNLNDISVFRLTGPDFDAAIDAVAALRIAVFRDWPYLYDGNLDHERQYIAGYRDSPGCLLVGAFHLGRLIGVSTSTPMEDQADAFATALGKTSVSATAILYGAESLLLPEYRGLGLGHRFIDLREAHARTMGRSHVAFASVLRPADHPMKPANARNNEPFWKGRGYAPLPGAEARFSWRDHGETEETEKTLQFWIRALDGTSAQDSA